MSGRVKGEAGLLLLVLIFGLGFRLALVAATGPAVEVGPAMCPDSWDYLDLARNLRGSGRFERDGRTEIFRTPGYPAVVATTLVPRVKSPDWLPASQWTVAAGPAKALLWGQAILDTVLVGLTFLLGRALVSRGAGLTAAGFQAICPLAMAAPARVLSDSVYAFLFTAAVLLLVRHLRTRGWRPLLAAAVVLWAACYVRPVGLAMAAVCAAVLCFSRRGLRRAAAFAGVVAACVLPWVVRNAVRADYVGFSSFGAHAAYYFAAPEVRARGEGISAEAARLDLALEMRAHAQLSPSDSPGDRARHARRRAWEIIASHPGTYARVHLFGSLGFWLPGTTDVLEVAGATGGGRGTVDVLHRHGLLAAARHYFGNAPDVWAAAAGLTAIWAAALAGAIAWLVRRGFRGVSAAGWLAVALVAVAAILPGPFGLPRYRLPVTPLLHVAAAAGWIAIIAAIKRRRDARRGPRAAARG